MHLVSYVLRRLRINKLKINIVIFGIQPYADQFFAQFDVRGRRSIHFCYGDGDLFFNERNARRKMTGIYLNVVIIEI